MKNLALIILLALFAFTSCNNDDDNNGLQPPTKDLITLAQENGYTSLAAALTKADLITDLKGTGPFTVFAPTNQAFDDLLSTIGQSSIDDVPVDVLKKILLYHVVDAKVSSTGITVRNVTTLEGSDIAVTTTGGIKVNDAMVINPYDVEATNGIIHTIEKVLVPTDIEQFVNTTLEPAYFNKNFTILIAAAAKAELVDALLGAGAITIFAPTNEAFDDAGIVVANTDMETLASVLTYHVVGAKVLSSEIPSNAMTLNGKYINFSITDNGNFINGDTEITVVDIEEGNGVVHVIDNVLMPPTGNIVETAIALSGDGEFTSLIAALQRTADEGDENLIAILNGDGPFTVFAPTNAAFQTLLDGNPDWNTLMDVPLATLLAVLKYHVVGARAFSVDLTAAVDDNNEISTVQGSKLMFDLDNLTINGTTNIAAVNVNATNGVIHVIDEVLVP